MAGWLGRLSVVQCSGCSGKMYCSTAMRDFISKSVLLRLECIGVVKCKPLGTGWAIWCLQTIVDSIDIALSRSAVEMQLIKLRSAHSC